MITRHSGILKVIQHIGNSHKTITWSAVPVRPTCFFGVRHFVNQVQQSPAIATTFIVDFRLK